MSTDFTRLPKLRSFGKLADLVLSEGFNLGKINLNYETKWKNFNVKAMEDMFILTKVAKGFFELDYNISRFCIKEKWLTDNTIITNIGTKNLYFQNFSVDIESKFSPSTLKKDFKTILCYKLNGIQFAADLIYDCFRNVTIDLEVMTEKNNWLCGFQACIDPRARLIRDDFFAIGYAAPEFFMHLKLDRHNDIQGSIYQKVNERLETGIMFNWDRETRNAGMGVGLLYRVNQMFAIRTKMNNRSEIGACFYLGFSKCFALTMCCLIDTGNIDSANHHIGMGVQYIDT